LVWPATEIEGQIVAGAVVGIHHQQGLVIAERFQGVAEFDRNVGIDEPPALDAFARGGFRAVGLRDDGDVSDE
jgi:hypothetical protein